MNQPTQSSDGREADPPKPDAVQIPSSAPSATPAGSAETPQQSSPPITRTISPTLLTVAEQPPASDPIVQTGALVDGYEILDQIGRGGMGVVFKARQPSTGQTVALKMIREGAFADAEARDRFVQEIQALGRVQPAKNIIPIFHVGTHLKESFYVMPFLAKGSLSRQFQHFKGDRRRAVTIIEKLARAVHQLHEHQIVHRDIKPSNILLDAEDEPFLGDFGLVKMLDREQSLTGAFHRLGTPSYMAPEQTGFMPVAISARTDIWSLGVLLYELTTGARPFSTPKEEETAALLWQIVHKEPLRPRTVAPDIDTGLEAIILKCLEKQPTDRFANALELADELGRWLRQEKVQTKLPPSALGRILHRHRWAVGTLVVATLAAISAVAAIAERNRRNLPEYVHADLLREFAEHGKVVLVPVQGPPRWHEGVIDFPFRADIDNQGYWTVDSWNMGLVALLRDLPCDTYRLNAEICHKKSHPTYARVGLFIGHQAPSTDRKAGHIWCYLSFNDVVSEAPPIPLPNVPEDNTARLGYFAYAETTGTKSLFEPQDYTKPAYFKLAGSAGGNNQRWRAFEIEVRPAELKARFDGQEIGPFDHRDADQRFRKHLVGRQLKDRATYGILGDLTALQLARRGPLGLFVQNGSIAVRNVTLTRLPN